MEIGKQIRDHRLRRGITQEQLAQQLGVTAQAVSKWEREAASPDIGLLPGLSAAFGIRIDELFDLSDDTRMERIQNMLWDVRYLDEKEVEASRVFLLNKARQEPENGKPHRLLADLENHLAQAHREQAAEYAREALRREPGLWEAQAELVDAWNGKCWDGGYSNHDELIRFYEQFLTEHPEDWHGHLWLMDNLVDDYRLAEAEQVMAHLEQIHDSHRVVRYRGFLAWHRGEREQAHAIWQEGAERYPDQWTIPNTVGNYLVREGRYEEALAEFRRAWEISPSPRMVDPVESMAQVYERMGQPEQAVAVLEEELRCYREEWHFAEGETYDAVVRHIRRLNERHR